MIPYQILIEAVFVRASETSIERLGFYSTFYVMANNASNAAHNVTAMLIDKMIRHNIVENTAGVFKTYYWIHDIWEVTQSKFNENNGKDSGFGFFKIGFFEQFYLVLRYAFFLRFKPWLIIRTR